MRTWGERTGCKIGHGAADKSPFNAAVKKNNRPSVADNTFIRQGIYQNGDAAWSMRYLVDGDVVVSDDCCVSKLLLMRGIILQNSNIVSIGDLICAV